MMLDDYEQMPEVIMTNIPERVNYSKLIIPMLQYIQQLEARVAELERSR
jgi:hypothetical protein